MSNRQIKIDQLEERIKRFSSVRDLPNLPTGWIKATRLTLGMSLQQLGQKLGMTKQGVQEIEKREKEGAITLRSLRETARALDMELVYGLVPKDGSIEKYIDKKAQLLAEKIVARTSNTMQLEDQKNSAERLKKAVEERKNLLKRELPKILWD